MSGRIPPSKPASGPSMETWEALAGGLGTANMAPKALRLPEEAVDDDAAEEEEFRDGGIAGLDAQMVEFRATTGSERGVRHGLGRVPSGFFLVACDRKDVFVAGWPEGGSTANSADWTETTISVTLEQVASLAVETRVRLLIF